MKKDLENSIKGYQALFDATMNPVFGTILMYTKRTGNIIKLNGLGLEKQDEQSLSF